MREVSKHLTCMLVWVCSVKWIALERPQVGEEESVTFINYSLLAHLQPKHCIVYFPDEDFSGHIVLTGFCPQCLPLHRQLLNPSWMCLDWIPWKHWVTLGTCRDLRSHGMATHGGEGSLYLKCTAGCAFRERAVHQGSRKEWLGS